MLMIYLLILQNETVSYFLLRAKKATNTEIQNEVLSAYAEFAKELVIDKFYPLATSRPYKWELRIE